MRIPWRKWRIRREQLENDPMKIPAKLLVKQTVADLSQLNVSMGNIKYTCNACVKLSTNSRTVKIYGKGQNDFLV